MHDDAPGYEASQQLCIFLLSRHVSQFFLLSKFHDIVLCFADGAAAEEGEGQAGHT